jgi:hypothetical protein
MRKLWDRWKRLGRKLGDFQARLLLSFFYFVVIAPFSLLLRFGSDPLSLKPTTTRGWIVRDEVKETPLERASKQF